LKCACQFPFATRFEFGPSPTQPPSKATLPRDTGPIRASATTVHVGHRRRRQLLAAVVEGKLLSACIFLLHACNEAVGVRVRGREGDDPTRTASALINKLVSRGDSSIHRDQARRLRRMSFSTGMYLNLRYIGAASTDVRRAFALPLPRYTCDKPFATKLHGKSVRPHR